MRLFHRQLITAAVAIVPMAVLGLLAIHFFAQRQLRAQFEDSAQSEARLSAHLLGARFEERLAILETIARSPELSKLPANALAVSLQHEQRRISDDLSYLAFANLDGMVTRPDGSRVNMGDMPIARQFRTGKPEISDFYESRISGRSVALFMVPVRDPAGSLRGVVGGTVFREELQNAVEALSISHGGLALLMDRHGAYVGGGNRFQARELAAQGLPGEEGGWIGFRSSGESYSGYRQPVYPGGWTVAVVYPDAAIGASTRWLRLALMAVVALAFFAGAALFISGDRQFLRPLEHLVDAMRRFGEGQHRARASIDSHTHEVRDLGLAFNRMAAALEERQRDRESTLRELADREALLRIALSSSNLGAWVWHVASNRVDWSAEVAALFGVPMAAFGGSYEAFIHHVFADDRPAIPEAIQRCFLDPAGAYSVKFRTRRPDGALRWMEASGRLYRNPLEEPERLFGVMADITDRIKHEEQLRETEYLISSIANNIPGGAIARYVRTADGAIQYRYLSNSIEDLLGYSTEEIMSHPQLSFAGLHPEDRQSPALGMKDCPGDLRILEEIVRVQHRNGSWRWLQVRAQPRRESNGALRWDSVILDVTERIRNEQLVAEQRGQLAAIFESAGDPIFSLDAQGKLLSFNQKLSDFVRNIYGISVAAGQSFLETLPASADRQIWTQIITAVNQERAYSRRVELIDRHGRAHYYDFSCQAIYGQNQEAVAGSYFLRDVTAQVASERRAEAFRLKQQAAASRRQQERSRLLLQGQEEERRRFARELHDGVGQMVSATLLGVENARSMIADDQRGEASEALDRIRQIVLDTIDEIHNIAQLLTPATLQGFGLAAALRQMAAQITAIAGLQVEAAEDMPEQRFEEVVEISVFRVMQEALSNALKYSAASLCRVRLHLYRNRLVGLVCDNGAGFAAPARRPQGGSGLGFMRERIALLGGRTRIWSRPERGVVVYLSVPLLPTAPDILEPENAEATHGLEIRPA
ncbi:MAG: PAS domain S-box protein [Leptospirales bacterium]|nr:PAS domain S-box protein [Leptospirales bacterium]